MQAPLHDGMWGLLYFNEDAFWGKRTFLRVKVHILSDANNFLCIIPLSQFLTFFALYLCRRK